MSCSGTVKFFNVSKGFGFIIRDDGENDIFVHTSDVQGLGLNENDTVNFDVEIKEDGRSRAANVTGGTREQQNDYNRGGYGNRGGNRGYNEGGYGQNRGYGNSGGYGRESGGYGNSGGYGQSRSQNVCFSFRDTGSCRFGEDCRFSHQCN